MQSLDKTLRNQLERIVKDARDIAEAAAQAALEQLGVREAKPFSYLNESDRDLRRRLRVHGRQLGDHRKSNGEQATDYLIEKIAYEHWHRMLFARFLAENNLLMYPDPDAPVAVTLEECEDLAADEGAANGWELAARFAARMLPQIFRFDSPVFQLVLPPEYQQKLERLVANLPLDVFTASDSLGWVYQFWQAKKKDEVNASEVKIGARELPAVTQLFTEPYMVSFLLDNSLGAWWAARRLTKADLQNADSEDELRQKASIPGVPLEYLRFVQQEDGPWTPAAGTFDGWPEQLADLKTLDPCCGSGHFLVAAFLMLVPMRMDSDGLTAKEAVDAVLRENIHGLELDQRCVELAAFALALAAWTYSGTGNYRVLPELNVACSGLSISTNKKEWLDLAGDDNNLRLALEELYNQFKDAPVLGSLINPEAGLGKGHLFELKWEEVGPLLIKALAGRKDEEKSELAVIASGLVKAAELLTIKYETVITNVPYLGQLKYSEKLKEFIINFLPEGKSDLSLVMLKRCIELCSKNARACAVLPQGWLVQSQEKVFRKTFLTNHSINIVANLGGNAFTTPIGAQVLMTVCEPKRVYNTKHIALLDLSGEPDVTNKSENLNSTKIFLLDQNSILESSKNQILRTVQSDLTPLGKYADALQGLSTGEKNRFERCFWEIHLHGNTWDFLHETADQNDVIGGRSAIIYWEQENGQLAELAASLKHLNHAVQSWRRGKPYWGKPGITINRMGSLNRSLYSGDKFSADIGVISPKKKEDFLPLYCFVMSDEFVATVRSIYKKPEVPPSYLVNIPIDFELWRAESGKTFPCGVPKEFTNIPTQWIFHGHPCGSVIWDDEKKWTTYGPLRTDGSVLHVAVARLLGYRWPAELDANMKLAEEQREWVHRCEALSSYADDDGIVCISPVRGEASASERLLNLLAAAYGDAWSNDILAALLKSADHGGKTLETWLREKFFTQHYKIFQHRPFIWHIWDGLRDGFAALVNYHKLNTKLLETLIYTYLGDWTSRQKQDIGSGVDGAHERLDAAESLKKKLELILEGESPYDIFVRWKPLEKQPIGWDPDLNDGVRLNIRPFLAVPDVSKKDAGILRDKPNIKWNKDRGKDVESAPWFHKFKGDRINDHHLTLAEKLAAQEDAE